MGPMWAYAVLAIGIITMSSGGIWFALLTNTPPLMQACWRLTITVCLQTVGVAYELQTKIFLSSSFWRRYRRSIPLMMVIGGALAGYFGSWGWSVAHTSLIDSLLLVCTTPLLMVFIMTLRWLYRRHQPISSRQMTPRSASESDVLLLEDPTLFEAIVCPKQALPPTWMEVAGAVIGFAGIVALLSTSSLDSSHHVTLSGNAAALLGALVVVVYFEGCSTCRKWMPLFIYSISVTAFGAVILATASLLFEPKTTLSGLGPNALFGFLGDTKRFFLAFGAAFAAGFFGHACANVAVVHVSPLLISVAALWEPLIGSLLGYLVGVQGPPDLMAFVAAVFLLGGALLVTLGGRGTCRFTKYDLAV